MTESAAHLVDHAFPEVPDTGRVEPSHAGAADRLIAELSPCLLKISATEGELTSVLVESIVGITGF